MHHTYGPPPPPPPLIMGIRQSSLSSSWSLILLLIWWVNVPPPLQVCISFLYFCNLICLLVEELLSKCDETRSREPKLQNDILWAPTTRNNAWTLPKSDFSTRVLCCGGSYYLVVLFSFLFIYLQLDPLMNMSSCLALESFSTFYSTMSLGDLWWK